MSKNKERLVKCPFYKKDETQKITCEGIVDGSSLTITFRLKEDKRKQFTLYCCTHNYKFCEIYRMLMSNKYDL